ncbi:Mandelamide hydrolase [Variovorax sp. PBL-H6]|uniref:amidase family protein n=1 Tax=Variovorax sp. PBL-H6 TaxID=434009 RepID=UPI001318418E|nr:amidase family protein [Variovorax sp. PBL-H6]VTU23791.1 Mandelamide hydrolase [Variovorax sp. PBL-H6]
MPGIDETGLPDSARALVNGVAAHGRGIPAGGSSLSAESCCRQFLERCETHRNLNAMTWQAAPALLEQARKLDRALAAGEAAGRLAGLPVVVKDNIDTPGFPTSAGNAWLRCDLPPGPAPVWRALEQAGALLLGKANMHELAAGATSNNPVFGRVRNPRAIDRIPGGSSGGTAAAIAAGLAPAGLGTDTSGSLRTPAAFCGIAALRPSIGPARAYSLEGIVPLVAAFDTAGPMARSVDDLILLHEVISGKKVGPPPDAGALRIGVPRGGLWEALAPAVDAVCAAALERFRAAGVALVEFDAGALVSEAVHCQVALGSLRRRRELRAWLAARGHEIPFDAFVDAIRSRDVRAIHVADADSDHDRAAGQAVALTRYLAVLGRRWLALMDCHALDAIAYPTTPVTAPSASEARGEPDDSIVHLGARVPLGAIVSRNARFAAALGLPALALPAGYSPDGLPVGIELAARRGDDEALLALGLQMSLAL